MLFVYQQKYKKILLSYIAKFLTLINTKMQES